jgi:hypothetical protein
MPASQAQLGEWSSIPTPLLHKHPLTHFNSLPSSRRVYKRSVIHHFGDEGGWRLTPYPPYLLLFTKFAKPSLTGRRYQARVGCKVEAKRRTPQKL